MDPAEGFQALRRGDDAHKLDVVDTALFNHVYGVDGAAAGRQHRVHHNDLPLADIAGQLAEVLDGLGGLLVAVQADMAHLGGGNQRQHPVHHAKAGTQDGDDGQLASGQHFGFTAADGGFHRYLLQRQIAGRLVTHQGRYLGGQLPKVLAAGLLFAHQGDLMLDQRMVQYLRFKCLRHFLYPPVIDQLSCG